jgi:GWxTD domain-containing protein
MLTSPATRLLGALVPLALLTTACGSWTRAGTQGEPAPTQGLTSVLDETAVFKRIGRLAAGAPVPFIGTVALLPGPGDSVLAILGLSLENRALGFERQGTQGFIARYRVDIAIRAEGHPPIAIGRDELVRVTTFQETMRNDESVLFQEPIKLAPGRYQLSVTVRDRRSDQQSRAEQPLDVVSFTAGSTTAPIFLYELTARGEPGDPFRGFLNPRGAIGYGGDTLTVLVEGYRMPAGREVPLRIVDSRDSVIFEQQIRFAGEHGVESQLLRFRPDSAPLGVLRFVLGDEPRQVSSALVSLSSNWIVSNYEEMIALLRHFGHEDALAGLRGASPADRPRLWREFYFTTDPNPATPENEALDAYFARLAIADQRFNDEGQPGWRTERGEVYAVLGEPDEVLDASAANQGRVIRWTYTEYRVVLFFMDETGFGRYRLTAQSRGDFERVRARVWRGTAH